MNRTSLPSSAAPFPAAAALLPGVYRFHVPSDQAGERLDRFLAQQEERLSRTEWRQIIDLGGVHLNGRRVRACSREVPAGADIEAYVDGYPLQPFRLASEHILYVDPFIIVIDKPAGIDTQPTHARFKGTLYEALHVYLESHGPSRKVSLGMVQRLDRDTSGVMVFSIHPRAHKSMTQAFAEREAEKIYQALVSGVPTPRSGEYRSHLARGRRGNLVHSVPAGGRDALTAYRVLEVCTEAARLELRPKTGRLHQIRAQCAEAGHPLLGDRRYGGPTVFAGRPLPRHMLHAERLTFRHPVSGEPSTFTAPLANDFCEALSWLGCRKMSCGDAPHGVE